MIITDKEKNNLNENKNICKRKDVPMWLVILDNLPTLCLFVLGTIIIWQLSIAGAIIYAIYTLFSVVWFWARICPHCHYYDTLSCPCGYGAISVKFFKRKDRNNFQKTFRKNIVVLFPNWFVPVIIAGYLLYLQCSTLILILTILFCIIGFLIIPLISKQVGCKECEVKDDCPWMKKP